MGTKTGMLSIKILVQISKQLITDSVLAPIFTAKDHIFHYSNLLVICLSFYANRFLEMHSRSLFVLEKMFISVWHIFPCMNKIQLKNYCSFLIFLQVRPQQTSEFAAFFHFFFFSF